MRIIKLLVPSTIFIVAVMCVNMLAASPSKVYAASPTNCGSQQTSVDSSSLASVLSTNTNALLPNSCFEQAYAQCSPATLDYDIKDSDTSFSAQLAIHNSVSGGCAVSASTFGVSMTCTLDNSQPLTQSLETTASQGFANCNGLLVDFLPKNIKIPAPVVTTSVVTPAPTPVTQPAAPVAKTTVLPNTGPGDIICVFLAASLLGVIGYRLFLLRSLR